MVQVKQKKIEILCKIWYNLFKLMLIPNGKLKKSRRVYLRVILGGKTDEKAYRN